MTDEPVDPALEYSAEKLEAAVLLIEDERDRRAAFAREVQRPTRCRRRATPMRHPTSSASVASARRRARASTTRRDRTRRHRTSRRLSAHRPRQRAPIRGPLQQPTPLRPGMGAVAHLGQAAMAARRPGRGDPRREGDRRGDLRRGGAVRERRGLGRQRRRHVEWRRDGRDARALGLEQREAAAHRGDGRARTLRARARHEPRRLRSRHLGAQRRERDDRPARRRAAAASAGRHDHDARAGRRTIRAAEAPRWEAFLARALPDAQVRGWVQRYLGYALTGDVREQCLSFFVGGGANGKSVLLDVVLAILGDYGLRAAPDLVLARTATRTRRSSLTSRAAAWSCAARSSRAACGPSR
jgi:hypothetical protein